MSQTIVCESEPCVVIANAPVIGEEPCVVRADAPVIGEEPNSLIAE